MQEGPYGDWGSRKYLLASLDASLGRMGVDYVDIFYSHRPDPRTPIEETMGALASAVHSGKALYAGISNYSPEQTRAAAAALAEHKVPLLIHQPRYNMFDRHIEPDLFVVLDELGIGSIVFSPLAQGLLTDRYLKGVPAGWSRLSNSPFLTEENLTAEYLERAKALNDIAAARGLSLAQLALVWVLRVPAGHERAHRRIERRAARGQLRGGSARHRSPTTSSRKIEPLAVHGTGGDRP